MTTKFWKPLGSSMLIRHPRWDFFAPVNSSRHVVPRPPVTYNCCIQGGFSSGPLKKKEGMISLQGIPWKINRIKDMFHNSSNNLEATFWNFLKKIEYFITEFIDVCQQFA